MAKIQVGGELTSIATDHKLVDAMQVKDESRENKTQKEINDNLYEAIGNAGTVDGVTLQKDEQGVISVKDGGIGKEKLAAALSKEISDMGGDIEQLGQELEDVKSDATEAKEASVAAAGSAGAAQASSESAAASASSAEQRMQSVDEALQEIISGGVGEIPSATVAQVVKNTADIAETNGKVSELDKVINGEGEVTITPTAGSNFVAEIDVEEGDTIAISATASVALTQNSYITLLMGGTQIYKSVFILKTKTSGTIPPYPVTSSGKVTIKFEYNEYTENSLIFTIAPSIKGALETIKEIKSSLDEMNGEIGNLSELTTKKKDSLVASINEINSAVGATIRNLTSAEIITGFYRVIPDGELVAMGAYSYTTPIKVYNGDIIRLNGLFPASVCAITKVDADNNVIKVLLVGKGADVSNYEYKIETDGFISISGLTTNLANVTIEHSNMPHYEPPIDNADHLWSITDNPLDYVKREAGYGAIIRNWGFIGDSYSSGETPAKNTSGTLVTDLDFYGISWGQQFARIIGANGYNFSNGGQTAKGWLRSQGTKHDSSYIGGEGGGDWRHAQLDKKQAYFISLGINDNGYITRWEQEGKQYLGGSYTLGNLTTDVDWNNYANNNENTFVGCYAGIIQRILSIQPKAKIFVVTQFQPSLDYINDAIRSIASKFPNNVFVVDLRRYAPNITDNMQYYMKNGHPTPYGYMYMAYLMNTYVDWIIRNNKDKFMDVTLIGTDYSL